MRRRVVRFFGRWQILCLHLVPSVTQLLVDCDSKKRVKFGRAYERGHSLTHYAIWNCNRSHEIHSKLLRHRKF